MWIPSHLTKEEFVGAWGIGLHAWAGNQAADEAAKQRAGIGLVPEELVARVLANQSRAAEVAHVVASVQFQRLQQRIRTEGGHAVKARKRKAPGGLRRMHVPGAKRACLRREERLGRCLRDLLMPGVRANVSAVEASRLLEQAVATEGFHDLWPLGPWPLPGTCVAKDGRLKWPWICRTCGARAGDTSRAVVLARTRCGLLSWEAAPSRHAVVQRGVDSYACDRCGRLADASHRKSLEESFCPARSVTRDGVEWAQGSLALADLMGRLPAFRRWAEPDPGVREAPEAPPPLLQQVAEAAPVSPAAAGTFLAGYRSHLCVLVSRKTVCCACFQVAGNGRLQSFRNSQCGGNQPTSRLPPFLRDGLRRGGVVADNAAALGRTQVLLAAVGGGPAPPCGGPAPLKRNAERGDSSQPGPLAAAGGAEARVELKRVRVRQSGSAEVPGSQAALDARASCPSGAVSIAVALWPPRQAQLSPWGAGGGPAGGGSRDGPFGGGSPLASSALGRAFLAGAANGRRPVVSSENSGRCASSSTCS